VAAPWAQRTLRLAQRLLALGVPLGGKAGVRLSHAWALVVSRPTLLRQGAPATTRVADRFHVLQNLAEALTQVFTTHGRVLDAVNATECQQPVPLSDGTSAVPVPPPPTPPAEQARAAQCAARRQARYDKVRQLLLSLENRQY
jgi:hypothetical protein